MFLLIFQILKFHFKKNILPWLWHISLTITICIPSPSCNPLLLFTKLIYDMSRVGVKVGDEEFLPFYFVLKRGWIVEKFTIRSHFFLIIHVLLFKLLSYKEKNIKDLRIFLILYKELFLFRISISSKNDSEQYSLKYKAFPLDSFYSLFNKL